MQLRQINAWPPKLHAGMQACMHDDMAEQLWALVVSMVRHGGQGIC